TDLAARAAVEDDVDAGRRRACAVEFRGNEVLGAEILLQRDATTAGADAKRIDAARKGAGLLPAHVPAERDERRARRVTRVASGVGARVARVGARIARV